MKTLEDRVMRVAMATALEAMLNDPRYARMSSQSTYLGLYGDRMRGLCSKANHVENESELMFSPLGRVGLTVVNMRERCLDF